MDENLNFRKQNGKNLNIQLDNIYFVCLQML